MSVFIQIETATSVCSCALSVDGEVVMSREAYEGQSHAVKLGLFVEEMMQYVRRNHIEVDAIAVSSGPGSYTGLRIGVSEAKGLSYGLEKPLIALPTSLLMADMVRDNVSADTLLCPMIDARRMEVYATFYDTSLREVRPTTADIVDENSYRELLDRHPIVFLGNGAEKCRTVLTHPHAHFLENIVPLASGMTTLTQAAFDRGDTVDIAYFEPFYLKEFVAIVGKNKVL